MKAILKRITLLVVLFNVSECKVCTDPGLYRYTIKYVENPWHGDEQKCENSASLRTEPDCTSTSSETEKKLDPETLDFALQKYSETVDFLELNNSKVPDTFGRAIETTVKLLDQLLKEPEQFMNCKPTLIKLGPIVQYLYYLVDSEPLDILYEEHGIMELNSIRELLAQAKLVRKYFKIYTSYPDQNQLKNYLDKCKESNLNELIQNVHFNFTDKYSTIRKSVQETFNLDLYISLSLVATAVLLAGTIQHLTCLQMMFGPQSFQDATALGDEWDMIKDWLNAIPSWMEPEAVRIIQGSWDQAIIDVPKLIDHYSDGQGHLVAARRTAWKLKHKYPYRDFFVLIFRENARLGKDFWKFNKPSQNTNIRKLTHKNMQIWLISSPSGLNTNDTILEAYERGKECIEPIFPYSMNFQRCEEMQWCASNYFLIFCALDNVDLVSGGVATDDYIWAQSWHFSHTVVWIMYQ